MSFVRSANGVKSKKAKRCCLCGEMIKAGEIKDTRSGLWDGSVTTMDMHPECHAYERVDGVVDPDWYEDITEPAFDRSDAIAHAQKGGAS